jgi:transketolase
MPAWNRFEAQSDEYKRSVLPKDVKKRLAIEMGSPLGWDRYTGDEGDILAINTFGASAPESKILAEYGFTVENVVARVKKLIQG